MTDLAPDFLSKVSLGNRSILEAPASVESLQLALADVFLEERFSDAVFVFMRGSDFSLLATAVTFSGLSSDECCIKSNVTTWPYWNATAESLATLFRANGVIPRPTGRCSWSM